MSTATLPFFVISKDVVVFRIPVIENSDADFQVQKGFCLVIKSSGIKLLMDWCRLISDPLL